MFVVQRFCFICDITLSVWLVTCRGCVSYSLFQGWLCWDLQSYGFILMCAWIELTYEQLECFLSFESLEVIYVRVHRHTHTRASLVAQLVKNPPAMRDPWVGKIPWRRAWQPTPVFLTGKSPWPEEPDDYSPWDHQESDTTRRLSAHTQTYTHTGDWDPTFVTLIHRLRPSWSSCR